MTERSDSFLIRAEGMKFEMGGEVKREVVKGKEKRARGGVGTDIYGGGINAEGRRRRQQFDGLATNAL